MDKKLEYFVTITDPQYCLTQYPSSIYILYLHD